MHTLLSRFLRVSMALLCLAALPGCVALIAGGSAVGGTLYATGDLKSTIDETPRRTRDAIVEAADTLELVRISGESDALTGRYVFRTGDDRRITIRYQSIGERLTEVSIRVGTFGDEDLSLQILRAIRSEL
ncbi:MAG: DUF3568 family protein [Opitutales bacterium]